MDTWFPLAFVKTRSLVSKPREQCNAILAALLVLICCETILNPFSFAIWKAHIIASLANPFLRYSQKTSGPIDTTSDECWYNEIVPTILSSDTIAYIAKYLPLNCFLSQSQIRASTCSVVKSEYTYSCNSEAYYRLRASKLFSYSQYQPYRT